MCVTHFHSIKQLKIDDKIINFTRWNKIALIISSVLLLFSFFIIIIKGFNWGLDFTGGTVMEINLEKSVNIDQLRQDLEKSGFVNSQIQNFGSNRDLIIRLSLDKEKGSQELSKKVVNIIKATTKQAVSVKRIEFIGPNLGSDLVQTGILALLVAFISILIYIGLRFEWHLALGVVISLVHDVILTLGILSLLNIEIDFTIVASLMSVIGYSLNDSIVVSDRIRENFRKINFSNAYYIVNISLTQTLRRTIITSATTLVVVIILFLFGGNLLKGFSITMIFGVFIGTISSIYIGSALGLMMGMKREHMLQKKIETES